MYKYIIRKPKNSDKLCITVLGNSPYSSYYVEYASNEIELKGDGKLLSTIKTKAKSLKDLKSDEKTCRLVIENIVQYSHADDNAPSLWRFDTLKQAEDFAVCFGHYQNPEWGRDIVVAKSVADGYYYVGEPELF